MICPMCGTVNPEGAVSCVVCQTRLQPSVRAEATAPVQPIEPVQPAAMATAPTQPAPSVTMATTTAPETSAVTPVDTYASAASMVSNISSVQAKNEVMPMSGMEVSDYYMLRLDSRQRYEVANKLRELSGLLEEHTKMMLALEEEEKRFEKNASKTYSIWRYYWPWFAGGIMVLFISLNIFPYFVILEGEWGGFCISSVIGIIIMIVGIVVANGQKKKANMRLMEVKDQERIAFKKEQVAKSGPVMEMERKIIDLSVIIPEQYCYSVALDYIAECIVSCRAESMKEAFNLFEEQLHRWKLENAVANMVQMQAQQAADVQRIRVSSGITAAATTANALYNIFS